MQSRIGILFGLFFLAGCQSITRSPLEKPLTRESFHTLTEPVAVAHLSRAPVVAPAIILPTACHTRVSVHVNKCITIGAVLEQLGQMLALDIQIDPGLYNRALGVTLAATNRPFIDVLENICSIAAVRYRVEHGAIFVEIDRPFTRSYNVQFLNLIRSSENRIASATDIFTHSVTHNAASGSFGSHSNMGENGSNTSVTMNSENDFWKELSTNLEMLLAGNQGVDKSLPRFTVHRQAGIISVCGTAVQHNCVRQYLRMLQKSVSSQILIEAKVIEVTLHDEFKSGIDWGRLKPKEDGSDHTSFFYGGSDFSGGLAAAGQTALGGSSEFFQYTGQFENGLYGVLQALQKFGSTKTLSSPRLTVMNNQSAILKVAKNHVYFKLNYNKHFYTKSDYGKDISVGSDIQTVPIGLVMSVQPAIDPASNSVILFLRPSISRLAGSVSDPSVGIANNSTDGKKGTAPESRIPIVEVKEIDSVLRLKDGEVAVLGGLMESSSQNTHKKAPILGDLPVVKEVFSHADRDDRVTEVVILIRVKILDAPAPDAADARLAHLYINDPRPLL